MLDVLPIGVMVFPGTGVQENLADKVRKLGIPVWRFEWAATNVHSADKALIRCSYSNDRFTVNLNSFGKAPDALHQAPLVPVTSRYLMARMSKLWTLATTPSSHPPATNSAARSFSSPAT